MTQNMRISNRDWRKANWTKNGRTIQGVYRYIWSSDRFVVQAGRFRRIISGDLPEWDGWKLSK